jgi:hypothetical protein
MHVALWVLAGTSIIGSAVCLLRPRHSREVPEEAADASAGQARALEAEAYALESNLEAVTR